MTESLESTEITNAMKKLQEIEKNMEQARRMLKLQQQTAELMKNHDLQRQKKEAQKRENTVLTVKPTAELTAELTPDEEDEARLEAERLFNSEA